jgi:odorant receptor
VWVWKTSSKSSKFTAPLIGADSLFFGACLNMCTLFDILRDSYQGNKQEFIVKHQAILKLSRDLNAFFKPIILTQFLISSMELCFLGFQFVMIEGFAQRIVVGMFGLSFIIQLFVYALGGQLLMDKSMSVVENFYETDRDFIMIIARAQKAEIIKAGFFRANLPTFFSMMNSAGSLIALLKSFMD